MARSLSLAAYMALARRGSRGKAAFPAPRPEGALIWAHAPTLPRATALMQLFQLLEAQRPGVSLLLTTPPDLPRPDHVKEAMIWQEIPQEMVADLTQFLDHWRPDLCLWSTGHLRPAAIELTARAEVPLYLVDAEAKALEEARFRWLPDMSRTILKRFDHIYAEDQAAAQRLGRIGLSRQAISVTGCLQEGRVALPCDEDARDELAALLDGRPVWLAAMVQPDELGMISQAQKAALRLSHRQLLILVPDEESDGPAMAARLRSWGFRVSVWSMGERPEHDCQVLVADTRGEMGLWYRLAPITFMASSLVAGFGGRDPYEPAALGSAVLYGPNVSRYMPAYSRFASAGAARIVKDADSLASALNSLSAPDQAAAMAHAGWEVCSRGAEVTDQLIEVLQDRLDEREFG